MIKSEFIENKYVSISLTGDFYDQNWIYKNQPDIFFKMKGIVNSILVKLGFDKCEEVVVNKNMFEHSIEFRLGGKLIAMVGTINLKTINHFDIDQQVAYAELELNKIFDFYSNKKFKVSPIRQFPFSKRDYAIMIDNDVDFNSLKEKSLKISKNYYIKLISLMFTMGKNYQKTKSHMELVFISTIMKKLLQTLK